MEFIELLTLLLAITFISKIVATFTKTVDILWYIIFGLIGTQYFFHIEPSSLENWATLGVVCIMFYTGWRENLVDFIADVWKNKWIALLGAAGPFLGAWGAFSLLGFTENEAIVAGFVFSSSAVPYTIAMLRNLGLDRTPAAKAIISSAMTDNMISILLAVGIIPALALIQSQSELSGLHDIFLALGHQFGLIVGAFILFAFLGFIILPDSSTGLMVGIPNALQKDGIRGKIGYLLYKLRKAPGFQSLGSSFLGVNIGIPMTLLLLFGLSWLAHTMGLHPAIGAYLTGLILQPSMFKQITLEKHMKESIEVDHDSLSTFFYFLQEWVGPIFFIYLGSQLIADWSRAGFVLTLAFVAMVIVGISQFSSSYLGGLKASKLRNPDAVLLGLGMLPCDVLAFVVLGVATTTGLIVGDSLFIIVIVVTILLLNIMTSLSLNWYKPWYLKYTGQDKNES